MRGAGVGWSGEEWSIDRVGIILLNLCFQISTSVAGCLHLSEADVRQMHLESYSESYFSGLLYAFV